MSANPPAEWHGCYNDSWQGIIVDEAFAHPAKFARGLIRRIYQHMLDSGYIARGDSIVDPFGGVGLGGLDAMTFGLHYTGCELEPKFVALGNRNLSKWRRDLAMLNGTLGTARLVQGDSRRLVEVVGGGMAASVSSPPYDSNTVHSDSRAEERHKENGGLVGRWGTHAGRVMAQGDYGHTPGQLGSMPSGDYAAAVSSPPYTTGERGHPSLGSVNRDEWGSDGRDIAARRGLSAEYGNTAGQLADMPEGQFTAAVSSPPYADAIDGSGEGPGARHDPIYHNGDNAYKQSSANSYGDTPGNLGGMAGDGFEAAVASPPFEESIASDARVGAAAGYTGHKLDRYGYSTGQLGEQSGSTFWAAARVIVEQTYAVLKPGGYAAWVCKDFVRKGQRVPFSDQWEALCAAVGFVPVERIHALLVADHGEQLDIFGGATARRKERKSFFRRLAEKNGSPRIDHEDVIIMRKP